MFGYHGTTTFSLLLLFGLLAFARGPVFAQTAIEEPSAVEACRTNLGTEGHLLAGYPGLIHAPVAFDDVRTTGDALVLYPEVRESMAVLASGAVIVGSIKDAEPKMSSEPDPRVAVVEFLQGEDTVVYRCLVGVVDRDPDLHKAAMLEVGNCNISQTAGLPHLLPGHAQVWEFPESLSNLGIWSPEAIDFSVLSDRTLYLLGKSQGTGILAWLSKQEDGFYSINLCVFDTINPSDAPGIEDKDMCKDKAGAPMRLSVGQTIQMAVQDSAGNFAELLEVDVALETVVAEINIYEKPEYLEFERPVFKALAPGSTSVFFATGGAGDKVEFQICTIVAR